MAVYNINCLNTTSYASKLVPERGVEPPTFSLRMSCSTKQRLALRTIATKELVINYSNIPKSYLNISHGPRTLPLRTGGGGGAVSHLDTVVPAQIQNSVV